MTTATLQSELDSLLTTVTKISGGSIDEIRRAHRKKIPLRTLQRRLAGLVEQKCLIIDGRGRGSRYLVSETPFKVSDARMQANILFSTEGTALQQVLRMPLHERRPVGYNRLFLDKYRPNETFYLSSETRKRLFEMGHSPDTERPAGTFARKILNRLLIDLSWNSSRLEGNTYSLLETERLLALGENADDKPPRETQMILNHKAAIELLIDESAKMGFNRYTILNLHALLAQNLLSDPRACGRLRTIPVGIAKTVYHPLEVPQLIEECFDQLLDTAAAIKDPFEQSFFAMVQLPYLQPFEDANKRVSRLAANIPFVRKNLCPLSFVDVPERVYVDGILGVYELNRIDLLHDVFVWAYERSCARYAAVRHSLGEPDPFRLKHRVLIGDTVNAVVANKLTKKTATSFIKKCAAKLKIDADQKRFIEVAEIEVMSLHEGNIARYRLRPSQYLAWKKIWDK